jgi:hypothetical protein
MITASKNLNISIGILALQKSLNLIKVTQLELDDEDLRKNAKMSRYKK